MKMRLLMTVMLTVTPAIAWAGGNLSKTDILERVSQSYNGTKLLDAKTIRIEEDLRMPYNSHDYGTEFHDFSRQRRHIVLDFENQRGSVEYMTQIGAANYHGRDVVTDGQSIFIDYGIGTYQRHGEVDFDEEYARTIRSSDVLLARDLLKNPEKAHYSGEGMWLGRPQYVMNYAPAFGPEQKLFIDQNTGQILSLIHI